MAGEERLSRDVGILAYLLCTPIVAWMYIDIFNIGKPLNPLLDLLWTSVSCGKTVFKRLKHYLF